MTDYRKTPDDRPWSRDLFLGDRLSQFGYELRHNGDGHSHSDARVVKLTVRRNSLGELI